MCEPQKVQYSILERVIVRIGNFIKQYFETRKVFCELSFSGICFWNIGRQRIPSKEVFLSQISAKHLHS